MRKILTFPRNGSAAVSAVVRSSRLALIGASLAVTFCLASAARAQTLAQQLAPTTMSLQDGPVTNAFAQSVTGGGSDSQQRTSAAGALTAGVDNAAYSVLSDTSSVQQASYRRLGRGVEYVPAANNPCNPGCDVSYYFNYEALFLRRENDERFSLSRNSFMPDFDYEFGGRYTIGNLLDCVNGWEVVYAGPFDWQRQATVTGTGTLQSQLQPLNGYTAAQISAFNSADVHSQAWRTQLQSYEFNRRWWVWDVISTMIGMRYVDYEEDYLFFSSGAAGTGLYSERLDNQLVGGQLGFDMLYPVSLRANVGVRGKAGVYANFSDRRTNLNNAGTAILNAGDSDVDVAGLFELGIFTNYHIVPSVRVTAGYEFWYLPGIATVPEQRPSLVSPASGTTVFDRDDLFLHGGSLGVQVLY